MHHPLGNQYLSYTYDNVGNRLTRNDSVEGLSSYTYDANDRLLTETLTKDGAVVDNIVYSYDDNGNLIQRAKNGTETTTYTWNDDNRLVRVALPNGDVAEYVYDDEGIRVSSTINDVTTDYLIDKNRPYAQVLEEFTSNELVAFYVYGHDLISQTRGEDTSFYQVDGLGSTRVLTDSLGAVTDSYDYDVFGNLIRSSGETENIYQFAGEQFDQNLDDYYLRQRFYSQSIGRFNQRDSYQGSILEPFSLHKYVYVNANPSNNIDPTGLFLMTQETAARLQHSQLAAQSYRTVVFADKSIKAAKIAVGFAALAAGAAVGAHVLVGVPKRNGNSTEYKLYPEDPKQRKAIDTDTQDANQMRVQLQYRRTHDHGIALLAIPEIGVTKAQVFKGLEQLWVTRRNGNWFPSDQDRNMYRAVVEVSEAVKASGPVSRGGQIATSQWFSNGRQAPRADYRVDLENLRGTNLRY